MDDPTRQRKLITDDVQHALGKAQMVTIPVWCVSQLGCLPVEAGCSLQDSAGVTSMADGVLAKGDSEINHDIAVLRILKTAHRKNIKFNADTIQFKMRECKFFGQLLILEGMSINLMKVEAIRQMGTLKCKKELESFQGMVNYLKCYSSQLTQVAEP